MAVTGTESVGKYTLPKSFFGFCGLWVVVAALVAFVVSLERREVDHNIDKMSGVAAAFLTVLSWRPGEVDLGSAADHFVDELMSSGKQYFAPDPIPDQYRGLILDTAQQIKNKSFGDAKSFSNSFITKLNGMFLDHAYNVDVILRRSLFIYTIPFVVLVFIYEIIAHFIYHKLRDLLPQDNTKVFVTGAFNAIDLAILASITSSFFNKEVIWFNLILFLCYAFHMTFFGIYIANPEGGTTRQGRWLAIGVYAISIVMSLLLAAIGIEDRQYMITGLLSVLACGAMAFLAARFLVTDRMSPYMVP